MECLRLQSILVGGLATGTWSDETATGNWPAVPNSYYMVASWTASDDVDTLNNAIISATPITVDPLATSPNWAAEGNQEDAQFGFSVGTAGDVNDDGYSDIIIGAPYYDTGQAWGKVFVYYGSATGLPSSSNPSWTAISDDLQADSFGHTVGTAGDVNGDGYSDVIVGDPWHRTGQDYGKVFGEELDS